MTDLPALKTITQRAPNLRPTVAVVLGSGWGDVTQHLQNVTRIPYAELDGFPQATVAGHSGELWLGTLGDQAVAVMSGRKHGYESGAVDGMALPLRTLQALGCHTLVQTNAAGSLRTSMPALSLMVIADHINLPQRSPLVGTTGSERFVGMVDAYAPALRQHAHQVAQAEGINLYEGVYLWAFGPQFETPAEIRMFAQMGADAVGMSTVPETILARHAGMRVLALSMMTNLGAGLSDEALSHAHTLAQAKVGSEAASTLLAKIIATLPTPCTLDCIP
jgi:purine-nucleoside phosphorylase